MAPGDTELPRQPEGKDSKFDLHPKKWTTLCDDLALSIGESHAKALPRRSSSGDL